MFLGEVSKVRHFFEKRKSELGFFNSIENVKGQRDRKSKGPNSQYGNILGTNY